MASFEHYATAPEAIDLVRLVVDEHHLRVIPELPTLAEPRLATYDSVTSDVEAKLAEYPVLQLEGSFTKYPIEFGQRKSGSAAGTYYALFNIGPRLRWSLPGSNAETGELIAGSLTMIDHYLLPGTNRYDEPSTELKATFLAIIKTLESHMVKLTVRNGAIAWIAKRTMEKVDSGAASLH